MLRSYTQMNAEEKAERTRKILRSLTQRDVEQLEELFDIMSTVGIKTQPSTLAQSFANLSAAQSVEFSHSDACGDDCPHKLELSRIDQFYSEVFF